MKMNLLQFVCLFFSFLSLGCLKKEKPPIERIDVDLRLEYQAETRNLKSTAVLKIGEGLDKRPLFVDQKIRLNNIEMPKFHKVNKGVFYQLETDQISKHYLFQFEDYRKEKYQVDIPFQGLQISANRKKRFPQGKAIFLEATIANLQEKEQVFAAFISEGTLMKPQLVKYKKGTLILPTDHLPKGKIKAFFYRLNKWSIQKKETQIKIQTKAISPLIEFDIF